MTLEIGILLGILALTFSAFAFEWFPIDVVSFLCLGLLLLFDLVTPEEAISGFANPAVITVMMMFILSDSLVHSGAVRKMGYRLIELAGASRFRALLGLYTLTGGLSAFINNTAAVSIFLPVAQNLAKHYKISPSKVLLPLSYAGIFGGTCTLVGTSTNLLVGSLAESFGLPPFSVFEFTGLGLILFGVGMLYVMAFSQRLLPSRTILSSLTRKYHMSGYLTEVKVTEESRLVGQTVVDAQVSERFEINVLEILRGKQKIAADIRATPLVPGDILIVRGMMEDILALKEHFALLLLSDIKLHDSDLSDDNNILAEIQVPPASGIIGRNLKDIDFRKRFGCFVLALNRTGESIREKVAFVPLRDWDSLLVFGPRARVEALYESEDFAPLQEIGIRLRVSKRWWLPASVLLAVILLASFGVMPLLKASILGVAAVLATRFVTIQRAYQSISWSVIFLIAAILPVGIAMQRTGLADLIAGQLAGFGGAWGPVAAVGLIYLVTAVLTEIMSNNSAVVLMIPISMTLATALGVDPRAFVFAVAFAGSSSFLTPMGYQTNAMVYGPGNYRFLDYIRVGAPLKILFWIISTLLIPVFWPVTPIS